LSFRCLSCLFACGCTRFKGAVSLASPRLRIEERNFPHRIKRLPAFLWLTAVGVGVCAGAAVAWLLG
jgi:hypothetical protein